MAQVYSYLDEESKSLLREIRDRLPLPTGPAPATPKDSALAAIQRQALLAVLEALDGWIEGAQSNHEACGHRGENYGEECWRQFSPADIRDMINDAARELGLAKFPRPSVLKENTR